DFRFAPAEIRLAGGERPRRSEKGSPGPAGADLGHLSFDECAHPTGGACSAASADGLSAAAWGSSQDKSGSARLAAGNTEAGHAAGCGRRVVRRSPRARHAQRRGPRYRSTRKLQRVRAPWTLLRISWGRVHRSKPDYKGRGVWGGGTADSGFYLKSR